MSWHAEWATALFGRTYQVPFVNYMGASCPNLLSPALNTTMTISSPAKPCSEMQSASPCHRRVYRYFQLDYKNCPQFADIPISKAGKDAGVRTHVWPWLQHPGAQGLGTVNLQQKGQQNLPERLKTTECAHPWRDQGKALGSADRMV